MYQISGIFLISNNFSPEYNILFTFYMCGSEDQYNNIL